MINLTKEFLETKEFQNKLKSIIENGDMNELTATEIRHQLEAHFGFDHDSLKEKPYKKMINQWIDQIIEERNRLQETPTPSKKSLVEPESIKAPRKRKVPSIESSDNDEEDDFQKKSISKKKQRSNSPPPVPKKKAVISSDSEEEPEVIKKPLKRKQPVSDEDEDMKSASEEDDESVASSSPPPAKKKAASSSKTTTATRPTGSDKEEDTIKRLKQFISKCGVRKVWARELADCSTASVEIKKLKAMLEDLGMKGKPTLDKCEAIKKERELKAELDSLDTSLILDTETKGGRATRLRNKSQSRPSYALDDNSTEEEDEEEEAEEKDDEGKSNASKSKKTDSGDDDASDGQEEEEDETSGDDFQGDESDDE